MNKKLTLIVLAALSTAIWLGFHSAAAVTALANIRRPQHWFNLASECPNPFLAEKLYEQALAQARTQGKEQERICLEEFAQFYQDQCQAEKAERLLRRALALGDSPETVEKLGCLLESRWRNDEALHLYRQSFKASLAAGDVDVAYRFLIDFYIRHHMAEAERSLRLEILDIYKTNAVPEQWQLQDLEISELAELAIERKRPGEALGWLALGRKHDWRTLLQFAWCHEQTGQTVQADAEYRQALQMARLPGASENMAMLDNADCEYAVRTQYAAFLEHNNRIDQAKAQHKLCQGKKCTYSDNPLNIPAILLYRKYCHQQAELLPTQRQVKSADLLKGMQFLYGKVVDEEYGLRQAVEQAKDSERIWRLEELCRYLADKKKTAAACDTLNQLFDLAEHCPTGSVSSRYSDVQSAKRPLMHLLLEEGKVGQALQLTHRQAALYDKLLGPDNCMKGLDMGFDAEIYFAHKFYAESIQVCQQALALYADRKAKKIECSFAMEVVLKCMAVSSARLGHLSEARTYYEKLVPESKRLGCTGNVLENLQEYAQVCQDMGDTGKAAELRKQREELNSKGLRLKLWLNKSDDVCYGGHF